MPFASFCSLYLYGSLCKIIMRPSNPLMQNQWNLVSIELIQIAGSDYQAINVLGGTYVAFWESLISLFLKLKLVF